MGTSGLDDVTPASLVRSPPRADGVRLRHPKDLNGGSWLSRPGEAIGFTNSRDGVDRRYKQRLSRVTPMDATPRQDLLGRQSTLSLILKAIRRRRGLRSAEVARDMNMALRS